MYRYMSMSYGTWYTVQIKFVTILICAVYRRVWCGVWCTTCTVYKYMSMSYGIRYTVTNKILQGLLLSYYVQCTGGGVVYGVRPALCISICPCRMVYGIRYNK